MSIWVEGATGYLAACHRAATDDEAFANFKRDRALLEVWEHVTDEIAKRYLYVIKGLDFHCDYRPAMNNDRFGNPQTMELQGGYCIAPTTCRYLWTYYMLKRLFGPLTGMRIGEIGGGYGGLATVIGAYEKPHWHYIYDLPEVCELQRKYLRANNLADHAWTCDWIDCLVENHNHDLLISTFALSELTDEQQAEYADKVIRHAPRGFLVCNESTDRTTQLICKMNKRGLDVMYEPVYTDSYVLWWGAQ